jgi:flagellar hook-associated protein 2
MRIGGLASGMDIDGIVQKLMQAERMPVDRLFQQRQWMDWQRDAYREVNLKLTSFREQASNMRFQSTFNAYTANSSNEGAVSASATADASPGTYNLDITTIAKAAKANSSVAVTDGTGNNVSSSTTVLAAGAADEQFTVTNGSLTATITVTDQDTYGSLAKKVADAKDDGTGESLGLRANFDDTTARFFVSTKELGVDQTIKFGEVSGTFVADHIKIDTATTYTGEDGSITFDGILIDGLKSNSVKVNGINLTLLKEGVSETITVTSDTDSAFDSIKEFVKSYNELVDELQGKLSERRYRDFQPLTDQQRQEMTDREAEIWDEKAQSGLLRNDQLIKSTLTDLRRAWYDPVEGINGGEIDQLADLGITTADYQNGGKLEIDENKLRSVLAEKPDEVMNFFTKKETDSGNTTQMGIGKRIYEETKLSLDTLKRKAGSPGVSLADQSVLGKNLNRLDEQIGRWEDRLANTEDRYWKQFTAMERAINEMNQQSAWMSQNMFGGTGGQ